MLAMGYPCGARPFADGFHRCLEIRMVELADQSHRSRGIVGTTATISSIFATASMCSIMVMTSVPPRLPIPIAIELLSEQVGARR